MPDLALAKVDTEGEAWISLSDRASLVELVVGVGHPQGLKSAMYWASVGVGLPRFDEEFESRVPI